MFVVHDWVLSRIRILERHLSSRSPGEEGSDHGESLLVVPWDIYIRLWAITLRVPDLNLWLPVCMAHGITTLRPSGFLP